MKLLKILLVLIVVLGAAVFFAYKTVHVEVDEADLPQDVYEENSDLLLLVNAKMLELFVLSTGDEYTLVEETVNLIILDAIRENVNEDYAPLGTCETVECNYITSNDNYYVNYLWAELSDDNCIEIIQGRHPVVEQALKQQSGQPFIANDCDWRPTSWNKRYVFPERRMPITTSAFPGARSSFASRGVRLGSGRSQ